jgi:hypothetical protein
MAPEQGDQAFGGAAGIPKEESPTPLERILNRIAAGPGH